MTHSPNRKSIWVGRYHKIPYTKLYKYCKYKIVQFFQGIFLFYFNFLYFGGDNYSTCICCIWDRDYNKLGATCTCLFGWISISYPMCPLGIIVKILYCTFKNLSNFSNDSFSWYSFLWSSSLLCWRLSIFIWNSFHNIFSKKTVIKEHSHNLKKLVSGIKWTATAVHSVLFMIQRLNSLFVP